MKQYSIVGTEHRKATEIVAALQPGAEIVLVAEPANPFDPNAVMVWVEGRHIGYVPRKQNSALFQFIMQTDQMPFLLPEHLIAMDAAAGSTSAARNPLRAIVAKFARSPNSNFPLVEV